jgi:hypothetical protein
MRILVHGEVRAIQDYDKGYQDEHEPVVCNPRGDLIICQGLPAKAELVRLRNSYFAIATTAVVPSQGLPTTAAQVTLFNNNPHGGMSLIVDSVFTIVVVSSAAATGVAPAVCMNVGVKTAPTTNLLTPKTLAGNPYRGSAIVATGQTITNDTWHTAHNSAIMDTTTQAGTACDCDLYGQYIVPPQHMFSVAAVANTNVTITTRSGIRWHEIMLPVSW